MTGAKCFRNETTLPASWSGVSPFFCGMNAGAAKIG
ncbi:MAG: hypothetical protein BWX50_00881 [Euryarchaeota archaeon ADurb.Bin009]|nr:MAG: hypothetical protein BWX50_00881 [Euryarchaeota archaeon ADurb.Bin009]